MKLTASTIACLALPDGSDDKIYFDDDLKGFGVRLRRSGRPQLCRSVCGCGRTRKIRLGSVAELDIGKARSAARTLLAQVRLGGDPASEKARARVRAGDIFAALLKPFLLRQQSKLKPRSLVESRRHLEKLCQAPCMRCRSRRSIVAPSRRGWPRSRRSNGPAAANRCGGRLGAFFSWAVMEGFRRRQSGRPGPVGRSRAGHPTRLLSDAELAIIWRGLGDDRYGVDCETLDLDRPETWRDRRAALERSRSWGRRNHHTVRAHQERPPASCPDSAPVRALIEAQPRRDDRDRVFAEVLWNEAKVALDKRLAESNGEPVAALGSARSAARVPTTLHDKLGVAPHIVEVLLGHVGHQAGVAGL